MFQYASIRTVAEKKGVEFCYFPLRGKKFYYKKIRKMISKLISNKDIKINYDKQIASADISEYFTLGESNLFWLMCLRLKWLFTPNIKKTKFAPIRKKIDGKYDYEIYDDRVNDIGSETELYGAFQSVAYFENNRESILEWFTLKKKYVNKLKEIEGLIDVPEQQRCCIHIRQGDMLYQNKGLARGGQGWVLPIEYYKQAISLLPKNLFYIITTDSPDYVKEKFKFIKNKYISVNNPEAVDMSLFGLCKYNVIANSTFSWWGAWLNKIDDKFVVSPMYHMGWAIEKWIPWSFEYHPEEWNYINVLELESDKT